MKETMQNRGYEIQSRLMKSITFIKNIKDERRRFPVFCTIDEDGSFKFGHITSLCHFHLQSSTYRPFDREDFDELETTFIAYCKALEKTAVSSALF